MTVATRFARQGRTHGPGRLGEPLASLIAFVPRRRLSPRPCPSRRRAPARATSSRGLTTRTIRGPLLCSPYTYDANGILRTKTKGTKTWRYWYGADGNMLYQTLTDAETPAASWAKSFTYAAGKLISYAETRNSVTTRYWVVTDQIGSVVKETDASGAIVAEQEYASFGTDPDSGTASGHETLRWYAGKEWDCDVELYYFNARWYDPELGRFITEDPARDDSNWYVYCLNSPETYVDPSGMEFTAYDGGSLRSFPGDAPTSGWGPQSTYSESSTSGGKVTGDQVGAASQPDTFPATAGRGVAFQSYCPPTNKSKNTNQTAMEIAANNKLARIEEGRQARLNQEKQAQQTQSEAEVSVVAGDIEGPDYTNRGGAEDANKRVQMGERGIADDGPCLFMCYLGVAQTYAKKTLTEEQAKKLYDDKNLWSKKEVYEAGNVSTIIKAALKELGMDTSALEIEEKRDLKAPDTTAFANLRYVGTQLAPEKPGHWQEGTSKGEFYWDPKDGWNDIGRKVFEYRSISITTMMR